MLDLSATFQEQIESLKRVSETKTVKLVKINN